MKINDLVKAAYENSKNKGWFDPPPSFPETIALMHSELSEALEFYREGREVTETFITGDGKPDGVPIELADVVIRIFTACGYYGIDLDKMITDKMAYNANRTYKHGGKVI